MDIIDALKKAAEMAQKVDNIELYRQLIDLSEQARGLQTEVKRLEGENAALRRQRDLTERIIRHRDPYISLAGDTVGLRYCTHCWDTAEQLVQLQCNDFNATFECPHCHMKGSYDSEKYNRIMCEQEEAVNRIFEEANNSYNSYTRYW